MQQYKLHRYSREFAVNESSYFRLSRKSFHSAIRHRTDYCVANEEDVASNRRIARGLPCMLSIFLLELLTPLTSLTQNFCLLVFHIWGVFDPCVHLLCGRHRWKSPNRKRHSSLFPLTTAKKSANFWRTFTASSHRCSAYAEVLSSLFQRVPSPRSSCRFSPLWWPNRRTTWDGGWARWPLGSIAMDYSKYAI